MSWETVGLRFICDVCRVQADQIVSAPAASYWDEATPEAWTSMRALNIRLEDTFSTPIMHLCPACAQLSVFDLVAKIRSKLLAAKT